MNTYLTYGIIFVILLVLELIYFKIADKFNIIDKPNERSSHSTIVLRGGGVIFAIAVWLWLGYGLIINDYGLMINDGGLMINGGCAIGDCYPWFLLALTMVAGVSFIDDIHPLPDSVRLVVQFSAMGLMIYQLFVASPGSVVDGFPIWLKVVFVVGCMIASVGATNIYNFMDGINGITAGYSIAVLIPLLLINDARLVISDSLSMSDGFVDNSLLVTMIMALVVFSLFNFRPRGKAKCFAGDVGSMGMAFIVLFCIGMKVMQTGDLTWIIFLIVYGVDGCCTIIHRIMLHENLGEAHRKHAYQLMANELGMSHVTVSLLYMGMQLVVSLGFIYLCPNNVLCHWVYLTVAFVVLAIAYVLFMKKYYHLHEMYLKEIEYLRQNGLKK